MRSLTDLLLWLPDVAPRNAHSLTREGDRLSKEQKCDLHLRSESLFNLVTLVGPNAAAAILQERKVAFVCSAGRI